MLVFHTSPLVTLILNSSFIPCLNFHSAIMALERINKEYEYIQE